MSQFGGRSSAHAALFCQEIASNIFELLAPPLFMYDVEDWRNESRLASYRSEVRATLARAARTCKAFSSPALAILWQHLDDFAPLVNLFSQGRELIANRKERAFEEPISDSEWTRFKMYAWYVRELQHHGDPEPYDVYVYRLARLFEKNKDQPLLPRLERLCLFDVDSAGLVESALLSPNLRFISFRLSVDYDGDGHERETPAIEHLCSYLTRLEGVRLEHNSKVDAVPPDTLDLLCSISTLRHLAIGEGSFIDSCDLEKAHALHSLSAELVIEDPTQSEFGVFPALHRLALRGRPEHLATFFAGSSIPVLGSLTLEFIEDPPLADCVSSIFEHVPSKLTSLSLKRTRNKPEDYHAFLYTGRIPPPVILLEVLEHTFRFSALERVEIDFAFLPMVDDEIMECLLSAWPRLTELRIYPGFVDGDRIMPRPGFSYIGGTPTPQCPSERTLLKVAKRCPRLLHLELPRTTFFDAARLLDEVEQDMSHAGHGLRTLVFKSDTQEEQVLFDVARLIDRLFPRLEVPNGGLPYASGGFKIVQDFLLVLRAHRERVLSLQTSRVTARALQRGQTGGSIRSSSFA
ncbi:hypothetical protein C8Q79DRAFT_740922 [Trametes meyenii]|nr:hypothetical protein C8Q79DRAFT_740922 [Trametes meyenii]